MNLARAEKPTLELGSDAYLRPLLVRDITGAYIDGLNDPDVNRFLVGPRKERQTRETVAAFVRQNFEAPDGFLFGIFFQERLCGTARLHDIHEGKAWIGIALFDTAVWGQGLARRAIDAVARHSFQELGVREMCAGIDEENVGSRKAFAAAGFSRLPDGDRVSDQGIAQLWRRVLTATDRATVQGVK